MLGWHENKSGTYKKRKMHGKVRGDTGTPRKQLLEGAIWVEQLAEQKNLRIKKKKRGRAR